MKPNKSIAILNFIKENHRYPNSLEISELRKFSRDPLFVGESVDGAEETKTIENLDHLLEEAISQLYEAAINLESRYKIEIAKNKQMLRNLDRATSKLEKFFLSKGINSNYISNIVEDFTNDSRLLLEISDDYVFENGLSLPKDATVTLTARRSYSLKGNYRLLSTKGNLALASEANPFTISIEGDVTSYIEYELTFNRKQNVSDILIKTIDIEHVWTVYDRTGRLLSSQTNYNEDIALQVNEVVDYLRIVCKKLNPSAGQTFKIFSMAVRNTTKVLTGTYYCGPYDVSEFSALSFIACATVPEKTSIRYFMSLDEASYREIANEQVYGLTTGINALTTSQVNDSLEEAIIDHENEIEIDCYYLNSKIEESVMVGRLKVKKNVYQSGVSIGSVPSGWTLDDNGDYQTNIEYYQSTVLECGPSTISFNGTLLTGTVVLNPGTYKIVVPNQYFYSIRENIRNGNGMASADPLYPFNGRYLIEGYDYHDSYRGNKLYREKQSIWAETLTYAEIPTLTNFSVTYTGGNSFLLVKTDYRDGWKEENYEIVYEKPGSNASTLELKIVLETTSPEVSPILHFFELEAI